MATEHIYTDGDEQFRYGIHITDGKFGFDLEEESEVLNVIEKYKEEFKKVNVT
jgi:hypothetical protein